MTTKEPGTVDRNSDETALREVWYARVLVEQGRRIPIKVDLSNSATVKFAIACSRLARRNRDRS